jgi:hypothetical protein
MIGTVLANDDGNGEVKNLPFLTTSLLLGFVTMHMKISRNTTIRRPTLNDGNRLCDKMRPLAEIKERGIIYHTTVLIVFKSRKVKAVSATSQNSLPLLRKEIMLSRANI